MSDKFLSSDLFKIGTNKDLFRNKLVEIENIQDDSLQFSIFNNKFGLSDDSSIIDKSELKKSENKPQNEVSTDDLASSYESGIIKKYSGKSAEQIAKIAMSEVKDLRESSFADELDKNINMYENLFDITQIKANSNISDLQNQINEVIKKALKNKGAETVKYEKIAQESADLQNEINNKSIKLQKKQRELESAQKEANRLKKEINELKNNPKSDKYDISSRVYEFNEIQGKICNLNSEIKGLSEYISLKRDKLKKNNAELEKIQKNILSKDKEAANAVKNLKSLIKAEEKNCQNKIKKYKSEFNILNNIKDYTYKTLSKAEYNNEPINFKNKAENVASLKDINYSSSKGQRLAQEMKKHAKGFMGYCSRHVSNGLERSGLGHERTKSAHMMDTELDKNKNFRKVSVSSAQELKELPAGCVLVYEAGAANYSSKHGHIEVTLGDGTACSDGITKNLRYSDRMSVFVPVED